MQWLRFLSADERRDPAMLHRATVPRTTTTTTTLSLHGFTAPLACLLLKKKARAKGAC